MSEPERTADTPGETRAIHVLYVEDNQQTGPLVREWLERHDNRFDVTLAVSLDDAVERLDAESFDAVVADYRFPAGKGLGLVPAAREGNPDLPFILYSARVTQEVADEAKVAGVSAIIEKGGAEQLSKLSDRIVAGIERRAETLPASANASDDRLEAFADELVHELRGPLSVALGHVDLLETDDERADKLHDVLTELEEIIDDVPERAANFEHEDGDD